MNTTQTSDWDKASETLKHNVAAMPLGQERKIREIIGEVTWAPLHRSTRHRFGKHVRANLEHYGLVFARMAGRIAVYKKSAI
ncbi:hypothetical protein J2Y39_003075 [Pseudomonas sp. 2957]|jgi:hypothetical protein|uniref:hypothetical protein n=1 Tax=unclassified Pseudomonas TaxID=196821 RepID=UPI0016468C24|nr:MULTISPECIES: hypothetical protein [unclassified Pseudomonas]MBC3382977.1 hypothetical protein [Pseudomonas sp. SWRI179]MDR6948457.1 hypothetical protein [Pseudomonas sp. 2957]